MPAPDYAAEIASLEAAAATGELTVEVNGERVTYRKMADLLSALSYFRNRAAEAAASGRPRTTSTLATFSRE